MTSLELEPMVEAARNGDRKALGALCGALEGPLFRLCLRMLGDVEDAADAAQDVMVRVITHLGAFEGRSRVWTWVYRIAVRHVMTVRKSRAEARAVPFEDLGALIEQGLAVAGTAAPPSVDDQVLVDEVRLSCTQGMLLSLSREDRLALVLVELLGLSSKEAAAVLEVTPAAFRQRLHRARDRLGTFLARRCGVAESSAPCRCERQVAAKQHLSLPLVPRLSPLPRRDLPPTASPAPVETTARELRQLRLVARAFGPGGHFEAPAAMRAALDELLPTLLGASEK